VVLDVTPADSALVPLLRAELGELDVEIVDAPGEATNVIAIQVTLTAEALEVRIIDRASQRATVQETFPSQGGRAMDARTAALHAVELLRWHLRFTPLEAPKGAKPKPSQARPAPSAPPRSNSSTQLGLMPLASYSPGGTSVGLGGELAVLQRWGSFGARVLAGTLFAPNRLSVPEGSVDVTATWGGLAGVWLIGAERPTSLELGAGAALFASSLQGTANQDNIGQNDHLLAFAPLGELRLRQRLTPGFALALGSTCLLPLQSSRLLVLDRPVGHYGQAVLTLGLGVELTLF